MRIEDDVKLDYSDVLIKPKRSALESRNVSLTRSFKLKHAPGNITAVPIIAANMDHTGTIEMWKALKEFNCMTALHKFHDDLTVEPEDLNEFLQFAWLTVGFTKSGHQTLERCAEYEPNICIDVANGYTELFVNYVKEMRELYPMSVIMAGNVATPEQTEELILAGADMVKVGIGPGSVCTTRRITGVGYPQLSAVIECADAAHGLGGLVCADGGCTSPGDVAKAFGAGADFVMLGGMLAGHDECSGEIERDFHFNIELGPREGAIKGMRFHGMASEEAQIEHYGGMKEGTAAEGKEVTVPYRGPVRDTIVEILGGVKGSMTMVGAKRLKDLSKCTTFIRVNNQINQVFS